MKKIFLCLMAVLASPCLKAQFNYTFSHYTEPYVPLTNGTSVNNGQIWDENIWEVPIGFPFAIDGMGITSLTVVAGILFGADINTDANAFMVMGADYVDRGFADNTQSMSPVRYELTGTSPNRIFKLEMFNAGFYDEYYLHSTLTDSINIQIWLYEGSDIVEFHYGDARTAYFNDYYTYDSSAVPIGYTKQYDVSNNMLEMFYYVEGDPLAPSLNETNEMDDIAELGTDTIPPSGMVYRFTPEPVSVTDINVTLDIKIYPSLCTGELYIEHDKDDQLTYEIFSITGVKVNTGVAKEGKHALNVSELPIGNYFIRLTRKQGIRTLKFTKI